MNFHTYVKASCVHFLAAVACCGHWCEAWSQTDDQSAVSSVKVISKPSGAIVDLIGEHEFKGTSPFILPYTLSGKYRIEARRPGFETASWEYTFTGAPPGLLNLKLNAKQPSRAFCRSAIIPGWGQYYSERKLWGTLFVGLAASSSLAYILNEDDYRTAQDQHRTALRKANNAVAQGTYDDQQSAVQGLTAALRTLNVAKRSRNRAALMLGAIWALNAIDSIVFFPKQPPRVKLEQSLDLSELEPSSNIKLTVQLPID